MSSYSGPRRAPNVSAYLQNLNHVPTAQELAAQDADFGLGDDLTFLTNAEFFDFDTFNGGDVADFSPQPAPQSRAPEITQKPGSVTVQPPQYQFGEFQTYPSATMTGSPSNITPTPTDSLQGIYQAQSHAFAATGSANTGDKRTSSMAGMPAASDLEEVSRVAAEEDKRRRNTAASARFRVKKKQREQALESQAKEMTDKLQHLESKVQQLETENKWLKDLLTEKSESKIGEALASKASKSTEKEGEERSTENRTDGVGTEVKAETKA